MASKKQTEANRRNARRSTGPSTLAGRAASSANAIRHGILSNRFLAEHEDREAFNALRAGLIVDCAPVTNLEFILVERLAMLFWRERRLAAAEAEQVERQFNNARDPFGGGQLSNLPLTEQHLVGRYQSTLGRQIKDTLRELREEQDRRIHTIEVLDPDAGNDAESG